MKITFLEGRGMYPIEQAATLLEPETLVHDKASLQLVGRALSSCFREGTPHCRFSCLLMGRGFFYILGIGP